MTDIHPVLGKPLSGPWPEGYERAIFGMGCFWGPERVFWQTPGVYSTAVGYSGGDGPANYPLVCTGTTGHAEVVQIVFDPKAVSYEELLKIFWEKHDPTQRNRQGNDIGSQYRSAIFATTSQQLKHAETSRDHFATALSDAGHGAITTQIELRDDFHYAEPEHQQYLHHNPGGYCPSHATGVACTI